MTAEQRKAIVILNRIRDYMKEELSEDDYMFLIGMAIVDKTDCVHIPPYFDRPYTYPQVTYTAESTKK